MTFFAVRFSFLVGLDVMTIIGLTAQEDSLKIILSFECKLSGRVFIVFAIRNSKSRPYHGRQVVSARHD